MAQTQLGRTYVQALDAAGGGASTNSLSLGTKSLTTSVIIGGLGTENKSITVNALGTSIAGPAFLTTLTTTGNSIMTNVSVAGLGVTGNVSMANVSINTLNVVGPTGLNTLEVSALSKLQNVSVLGVLDVVGQIKMGNVSTTSLTATSLTSTSLFATNLSVSGLTTLNNASVKGLLYANEMETPFMNVSTTATIKDATITGTLGVTGKTTLQALDVNGVTKFNNTVTVSGTDNSLTVDGITTLNNASVNGTLAVVGNCTLSDVRTNALTATGNSKIGDWFMYGGTNTKVLGTVNHTAKYALLQDATGVTALNADNTVGGGKILFKVENDTKMTLKNDGSFGIGVLEPTTKLDVGGTVKVEGVTNINTTGSANTTIGNSTGGLTVNGAGIKTDTIDSTTGANILSIANTARTFGGNIDIGKGGLTGNSITQTTGITIGSGTNGANSFIQLGSDTLSYNYLRANNVMINDTGTGSTYIGNSTGGLTVNGPGIKTNKLVSVATTDALSIGTDQTGAGTVAIGATANTTTTINGKIIKQVTPLVEGGTVETVIGDATNVTSMSTTFNRKRTEIGAVGALNAIGCYTIVSPSTYTSQYFEIVVSGSNNNRGGYSYKGCFAIEQTGAATLVTSVNTLFYVGMDNNTAVAPVITFTIVGSTVTLNINTSNNSTNQNFISTLIAYPTLTINNTLFDYTITAI